MKTKSKKSLIIQKSANLFLEKGYAASSIREIAQQVELEPSSIYSHVKSKKDILAIICFDHARFYLNQLDIILRDIEDPRDQLRALLDLHLDRAIDDRSSAIVFGDEWRHLDHGRLKEFTALRKEYESKILNIIQRGIEQNYLYNCEPTIMMQTILSAIRWVHYWYKPSRKTSKKKIKEDLIQMLLNGFIVQKRVRN